MREVTPTNRMLMGKKGKVFAKRNHLRASRLRKGITVKDVF